jgi:large subunit ribosomal protein L22
MENETVHINGRGLSISTKHCIEISNFIRNKSIKFAKTQLSLVLEKKVAIPLRRFNKDKGHKPGKIAAGSYPQNASKEILKLLNSLEGYAQHKGMDKDNLYIKEIISNRAPTSYHYGRIRGIQNRSTHIKIVAAEMKRKEKPKNEVKKEIKKPEPKKVEEKK